jgi:hypothetical protein
LRVSNKVFYKLGDVDTKIPMKDRLKKCLDLDIPILVKAPINYDVWAIDPQLDLLTKADVVQSESSFDEQIKLMQHFYPSVPSFKRHFSPKISTHSMMSSTKINDVEYLQLLNTDIEKLIVSEDISVVQFRCVGIIENDEFTLQQSVPASLYRFKLDSFDTLTDESIALELFDQKVKFKCDSLNFVFCAEEFINDGRFNFPIGNEQKLSVNALECYIKEGNVSQLVFDEADYIHSSYHLEPEYHASSSFLELSKAGYDLFVKKVPIVSGGNSGYLSRNHPSFKKKTWFDAGVFLIKSEGSNFKIAKEIYTTFWLPEKKLTKKEVKAVVANVRIEIDEKMHTNEAYIHSIELIIRPDKYKKA